MTLADKIVVLQAGKIEQVGSPRELYERPDNLFVAQFIGSPKMNVVPCSTEGDRFKLPGQVTAPSRTAPQAGHRSNLASVPSTSRWWLRSRATAAARSRSPSTWAQT